MSSGPVYCLGEVTARPGVETNLIPQTANQKNDCSPECSAKRHVFTPPAMSYGAVAEAAMAVAPSISDVISRTLPFMPLRETLGPPAPKRTLNRDFSRSISSLGMSEDTLPFIPPPVRSAFSSGDTCKITLPLTPAIRSPDSCSLAISSFNRPLTPLMSNWPPDLLTSTRPFTR